MEEENVSKKISKQGQMNQRKEKIQEQLSSQQQDDVNSNSSRFNSYQQGIDNLHSLSQSSQSLDKSQLIMIKLIQDKLLDNKYQDIIDILSQNKDINILAIADRKKLTLIHRMTFHMSQKEVSFILKYGLRYLENHSQKDELIRAWVNSQNDEGFTALHYASFKGDIEIISYLIQYGADYNLQNKNGLNVLHIAAQGDQPISLCYFHTIGFDLNVTDQKGGTSLHWACYLGSENAVNYLVSKLKHKINSIDGEGLTPLHLAVISGNARVVKKLLQRGADRNTVDFKNKTPAQLAEENEYFNIQSMLEKTGGFAEYCNIKQPFKPMKKNPKQLIVLLLLLFIVEGTIISFIIPCFNYHIVEMTIWGFLIIGTLISLVLAWKTNPGEVNGIKIKSQKEHLHLQQQESQTVENNLKYKYQQYQQQKQPSFIKKSDFISRSNVNNSIQADELTQHLMQNDTCQPAKNQIKTENKQNFEQIRQSAMQNELIQLYLQNEVNRICVECCIVKPKRSRHCEICKKCIRVYDHHCPWINNCVGAQNFKYFILFIVFMWFNMLISLLLIFFHISQPYNEDEDHIEWDLNWFKDVPSSTANILNIIKYIISGLVIALTLFFFVLHTILCFVQLSNLFLNQTTFERYNVHQAVQTVDKGISSQQQVQKSSQTKSNQSSSDPGLDLNPSIIQSNSKGANLSNKNKLLSQNKKYSLSNACIMCCSNSNDPSYDYAPPHIISHSFQGGIKVIDREADQNY